MTDERKSPLYEDTHCDDEDAEMDRRISQVAFVAYQQAKMKSLPVPAMTQRKRRPICCTLTDTANMWTSRRRKCRHPLDLHHKIMYNGSRNSQKRKDERP